MKMKRVELFLEHFMFGSRWLLVPFYIGLIAGIALLLVKFVKAFFALIPTVFGGDGGAALLGILTLVDITLVANLLLIIIFAGYENFVSKIDTGDNEDRPEWMGHVGFSDLKLKLIGSIVAISGIELLKYFINVKEVLAESNGNEQLAWLVGIHFTLVVSGVMFATMDKIAAGSHVSKVK
ncbi:MAG TPA: TIGR00645 family protein [Methylotenera sp.]|nr:TIGR00645 family protein [Methylotenera sp.]HPH04606.1 TIGR00645 family protein [Methylotenera sp.]HPN01621.1 TIGR00645 family protein [Methylotenera sp.]